jgi:polysaccharide export outer membrane protein
MIGEIPAADRSEVQLRAEIEDRLRDGYMREPHVTVSVVRYLGRQVSVTGAVPRPGVYSLTTSRRTLYDVLSQAGGLTDQAGGRIVFTPASVAGCLDAAPDAARSGSGPLEFSVTSDVPPGGVNPLEIPLVAGDSVVVKRGRFLVDGWVANPGLYTVGAGMTALDAASIAGGTLFPADLRHVEVVRSQPDGSKKVLFVDLSRVGRGEAKDLALNEGDVVRFGASPVRMVPYSVYWVFKNLFNVGAGVYVPNT